MAINSITNAQTDSQSWWNVILSGNELAVSIRPGLWWWNNCCQAVNRYLHGGSLAM